MLSVIIITKNEEVNIRRCLESVSWADEIIVVDSGSTDRTLDIAREFTSHVYSTDWQGYGVQKQRALSYATHPWVLNLDADESVDVALRENIIKAMVSPDYDAYRIPIRMCFYGKMLRFSSSPSRHVRLFKRTGAAYSSDLVHEKIILSRQHRVGQLRRPIVHHSLRNVEHAVYKMNKYSSYSARIKLNQRAHGSLLKTLGGSCWMFLRCYILQRGFLDGRAGLFFACLNAHGSFYRGMKVLYPE